MYLLSQQLQDVTLCTDIFTSVLRGESFRSVARRLNYSDTRVAQLFYKIRRQMYSAAKGVHGEVARQAFVPFQDEFNRLPRPTHYVTRKNELETMRANADRFIEYFHYLLGVHPAEDLPRWYPEVTEPCTSISGVCASCLQLFYTHNPHDRICYRCLKCAQELQAVLQTFTQE